MNNRRKLLFIWLVKKTPSMHRITEVSVRTKGIVHNPQELMKPQAIPRSFLETFLQINPPNQRFPNKHADKHAQHKNALHLHLSSNTSQPHIRFLRFKFLQFCRKKFRSWLLQHQFLFFNKQTQLSWARRFSYFGVISLMSSRNHVANDYQQL
jgi:hypothetical protein